MFDVVALRLQSLPPKKLNYLDSRSVDTSLIKRLYHCYLPQIIVVFVFVIACKVKKKAESMKIILTPAPTQRYKLIIIKRDLIIFPEVVMLELIAIHQRTCGCFR